MNSPASHNDSGTDFLREFGETRGYLLGRPARPVLTPAGDAVVFLRSSARASDQELHELDLASGRSRLLVRPADLLFGVGEEVSAEEQARRERQRITDRGFTAFSLSPDGLGVLISFAGRLVLVTRATGAARVLTRPEATPPLDPRFSPDGRRIAFVRGGNLHVLDLEGTALPEPRTLTSGGGEDRFFGLAEFVAQEEMARFEGFWWAPDGNRLAYAEVDQRGVERFSIADPARPERPPQTFAYPRAGRVNARVRLLLAPVAGGSPSAPPPAPVLVDWDRERYPYLCRVLWDSASAPLAILVQTRDQREVSLLAVDETTGATRPLIVERDEAWVNFDRDLPRGLPDGSAILWATEKAGTRALCLHKADGSFDRDLCAAGQGFVSLVQVTPDSTAAFVLLGDALTTRLERLDLTTGARTVLLDEPCDRTVQISRDGGAVLETRTGARLLPETRVLLGPRVVPVPSVAATPPFRVNLELLTTEGEPGLHAAVIRPRAFVPGQRYPVVLHVYGGPHSQMVRADERHYLLDQWIADQGVIVVALDNRGTPRRGRAFERAIKGHFGDVPLDDQVAGLQALGRRFPELDLTRVGVYGWSFGGFMAALAVLRRPDLFKVAVAGAPVVDWGDYDTHYTERYLELPERNPEGYRAANLLTYAADLTRPLLIIHGTADDNVYFFHSLKLVDALVRAGRPFQFLPLPRVTHQISDPNLRAEVWRRVAGHLLTELRRLPTADHPKDMTKDMTEDTTK